MKLLLIPVLLTTAAFAQSCPVKVNDFHGNSGSLKWEYTNADTKQIDDIVFYIASVDSLGDVHKLLVTPEIDVSEHRKNHPFVPGADGKTSLRNDGYYGTYRIILHGVRYADGSVWKDDGTGACYADGRVTDR